MVLLIFAIQGDTINGMHVLLGARTLDEELLLCFMITFLNSSNEFESGLNPVLNFLNLVDFGRRLQEELLR
jgi:hypothetical protein